MLNSQQALAEFDFEKGLILPDRLTRLDHAHYLPVADQLLKTFADSLGETRQRVHQRAEVVLEQLNDCSARRMAGLIKLLDDVSQYESDRGGQAAKLRQLVFQAASSRHPLTATPNGVFTSEEWAVKREIAKQVGKPWELIERGLYSDVIQFHPLKSFEGYESGAALLARYNVAQVQACLYRATRMTLWAKDDLKTITRTIKLSRLMHDIRKHDEREFQFILSGPASALRSTRRYGVAMAKMIPSLLACRNWRLAANIAVGSGGRLTQLILSSEDGLTSPKLAAAEFDSEVEADLVSKWQSSPVDGWTLHRECDLLVHHQKIFLPDFQFVHASGKKIHLEIVGYWTPEYIEAKLKTLHQFAHEPIWIVAQSDRQHELSRLPASMLKSIFFYKTKISLKDLAERLGAVAGAQM